MKGDQFNGILTLHRLAPNGTALLDEGVTVFDGSGRHPKIEGPYEDRIVLEEGTTGVNGPHQVGRAFTARPGK